LIDEIDKIILQNVTKNARVSSIEITRILHEMDYAITERAVRYRMKKMEKDGIIMGYSTIINPLFINSKINKTLLIKFKIVRDRTAVISRLQKYLDDSAFCIYSCKIQGDYDFICHFVLDSNEQFDLEIDNFINQFSDLISDFRSFDSSLIKFKTLSIFEDQNIIERKLEIDKIMSYMKKEQKLDNKLQFVVESLVRYFDAAFARVWIVDESRENLILKSSAGKYTRCDGEFSKVAVKSNKIGHVFRVKRPVISNDVPNDPRIRYPQWAKQENLKSFAGYPILYNGKPIGVLAMFSKKRLKPLEFELMEVFCKNVSRELSNFFDNQKFLFTK
jgi:DNA-binding Lrp family transcriptional regulator